MNKVNELQFINILDYTDYYSLSRGPIVDYYLYDSHILLGSVKYNLDGTCEYYLTYGQIR